MNEKSVFLRVLGPAFLVIAIGIGGIYFLSTSEDNSIKDVAFRGIVQGKRIEVVQSGRHSREVTYMIVETDDKQLLEYLVDGMSAEYYVTGDYMIKEKGELVPAVFRNGNQLNNSPAYLKRPVSR